MEWLESLLPLVIFAIYFLSRLRKAARQPQRQPAPQDPHLVTQTPEAREEAADGAPSPPPTERPATPFEALVQQIQEAAREAARDTMGEPRPEPPEPEFQPVGAFEHEAHGFGPDNPFSEEAFEQMPRGADIAEHATGHLDYDPHDALPDVTPHTEPTPRAAPHPLVARLRRPSTAREAVVLREILDRPRVLRRR